MNKYLLSLLALMIASCWQLAAQPEPVSFTNQSGLLGAVTGGTVNDCAVDMNKDGLDDVVRVQNSGIHVDLQRPDGTFSHCDLCNEMRHDFKFAHFSQCAPKIDLFFFHEKSAVTIY